MFVQNFYDNELTAELIESVESITVSWDEMTYCLRKRLVKLEANHKFQVIDNVNESLNEMKF